MSVKCQRDISPYFCWQQAATFKLRRITSLLTAMSWNCPLIKSLLVPGPPPRSKNGHYLLPYGALLKLFHVEKILPSCTGSFARYTFSLKGSVECASDDIDHRRHCSPIWGLRITVDNSGVLTLPDVWHIPPGRAEQWQECHQGLEEKGMFVDQGLIIAKFPSPSLCSEWMCPHCTFFGVIFGFMPILLISQGWGHVSFHLPE